MRCNKRYANGLFLCKKNSCRGFYSKTEILSDPLVAVGFSLQEEESGPILHRTTSALTRKSHGQHMWI